MKNVLGKYLESSSLLLAEINTELKNNKHEEIYQAAHKIKSQSASVGAIKLSVLCAKN